jgi:hypothetical protein
MGYKFEAFKYYNKLFININAKPEQERNFKLKKRGRGT